MLEGSIAKAEQDHNTLQSLKNTQRSSAGSSEQDKDNLQQYNKWFVEYNKTRLWNQHNTE